MKTGRAPLEVRDWLKLFDSSALYRHDAGRLFEDWVEVCICCFANRTMETRYLEIVKRYTREELNAMAELMAKLILLHEDHTAGGGWFDGLGQIYEHLASRSKASRMGQFFTPPELCDLMARITLGDEPTAGKRTSDPCCGSGRLLLAQHAIAKDLDVIVAADVDPICAKMCALNFWLHGIRGEVACMDSLGLKWYFAYQTHPRYLWPFITYIGEDRKEESWNYIDAQRILQASVKTAPVDLFNQVSEPEEDYGNDQDLDEEPFKPCSLCGREKSTVATMVNGEAREIWTTQETRLLCMGCHVPLWNERVIGEANAAAEPSALYGEEARRQRHFNNEKRQVLDTLKVIADVLQRNKANEAFELNKKRIALELRLRGVELKGETITCYLGKTLCRFPYWNIDDVLYNAKQIYKHAA